MESQGICGNLINKQCMSKVLKSFVRSLDGISLDSGKQKNAAAQKKKQEQACGQKFFSFHSLTRSIVGVFYEEKAGEMLSI